MRSPLKLATSLCCLIFGSVALVAQKADGTRVRPANAGPAEPPHRRAAEVGWRLAPADQPYAAIDGAHLKRYVEEQTAISRRYRDNGHPQY